MSHILHRPGSEHDANGLFAVIPLNHHVPIRGRENNQNRTANIDLYADQHNLFEKISYQTATVKWSAQWDFNQKIADSNPIIADQISHLAYVCWLRH